MRALFWIWGAALLGVLFVLVIDTTNPGQSLCFSQTIFGIACPACGMGRAFHMLLHFRLWDALRFNPLVIPAFLFVFTIMVTSLMDVVRKTDVTRRVMNVRIVWWWAVVAALAVGVVWVRNLQIYG